MNKIISRTASVILQKNTCTNTVNSNALLRHFSMAAFPSRTLPLSDKLTIKVPSMGDSISEGTIVEWTAQIGQAVKVDDVIALIETDKVTIDIKAQVAGVIIKHFAEVEAEVEVGAELYEIDTEAEAEAEEGTGGQEAASASKPDTDADADANATSVHKEETPAIAAAVAVSDDDSTKVRVPSIQFLGKQGWKERRAVQGTSAPVVVPAVETPTKPNAVITLENGDLPSSYGRMPFSEREMEDLGLGGASEAPYATYYGSS